MSWGDLSNLDAWLAAGEARVPNLRPGVHRRVHWAGDAGQQTDISVVYIHGFSATSEELRPFPDLIAQAFGANLHFARLTGHGQDGAAMGQATQGEWLIDTIMALDVARAIGRRVIVIACSTGAPLVIEALSKNADQIAANILVSPNFGMAHPLLRGFLNLPGVRHWGRFVMGCERKFDAVSDAHAAFWTVRYDTRAVFTMMDAVRAAGKCDLGAIKIPTGFIYCEEDKVVSPAITAQAIDAWGGPTAVLKLPKGDNDFGHLLMGDVFNPAHTDPAASFSIEFCQKHLR